MSVSVRHNTNFVRMTKRWRPSSVTLLAHSDLVSMHCQLERKKERKKKRKKERNKEKKSGWNISKSKQIYIKYVILF